MATQNDTQKIRECMDQMFLQDAGYRDCILRSGLFLPRFLENGQRSFIDSVQMESSSPFTSALDLSPDLVDIQCSSDPLHPSEGCCNAVSLARQCRAANIPKSHECKNMLDAVVWDTYACPRVHGSDVVGILLALLITGLLFAIRYVSRSGKSQVWLRQLWGLLVKNWRMSKHRWGRQFKGVFISMVLFGIVIALLSLTGEVSDTYQFAIPNSQMTWSFTFTGPDDLRATILENLRVVAGLLFIIAFTYPLAQVVLSIVQEKELLIVEAMKVTGLYDSILLLSWSLSYLVSFLPLCILTAIITHFGLILPNVRVSLLIMFFCSFCAAMVSFSLAFSAFFDTTRPAIIFILLATFVLSFLIYLMPASEAQQGFMCLVAPACLGLGISNELANTSYGTGFRMAYLSYKNREHVMSMDGMTAIMFFDALLYAAIGWYLDKVLPKKVGIRYPWHFFLHRSFWRGQPSNPGDSLGNEDADDMDFGAIIEPATTDQIELCRLNKCVRILSLCRKFKTPGMKEQKVALDCLNLTFYEGQITSLLGHNGAGKTTLIRILCGLVQPSSGDAKVFGSSILKHMPSIRRSLGMCPQHDILFEDMTCYENLWLFAALKGVPFRQMKKTIAESLAELGMSEKIFEKVETLSGGQKRKLCVAIAFIGRSRVVFLDEPTSGMDPYSRRFTWEVLLKNRKDRVIILTTHFMDEAEVLGDRVAIVNDGRLCCFGTSLFLKQQFGNGYTISLSVSKDTDKSDLLLNNVHAIILKIAPDAKRTILEKSETSYQVPSHNTSRFSQLFRALEAFGDTLEFGISNCTLEDVFLSVAEKRQNSGSNVLNTMNSLQNASPEGLNDSENQLAVSVINLTGSSFLEQNNTGAEPFNEEVIGAALWTMVLKRWWLAKRDHRQFFLLVLLPIAFLFLPILLPDIEIVQFVEKGEYVRPVPGPPTCNPADAFNPLKSCSSPDLSDCFSNGIQVLPQHLLYTWMRNVQRCRRDSRGWDFCRYVPFICNPAICCDFTDYRSLLYPCQTHTFLNGGFNIHNANIYCPSSLFASIQGAVNAFIKSLAVLLAFLFCPSMIIAHTVMETESQHNTKFQQLVSGVRKVTYWAGAAIWDFSTIFVTISAACVIIMYYTGPLKDIEDAYFVVVALFIAYGIAVVPSVYWLSFRFSSSSHALAMLLVFNIASGAGLGIIAYIMKSFAVPIPGSLTLTSFELYSYSRYILLILPAFNLIDGLLRLQTNTIQVCIQRFQQDECSRSGTMKNGFRLLTLNFIYLGLLFIICFVGIAYRETKPKSANEESTRSKIQRKVKKHWRAALSLFNGSFNPDFEVEDIDVKRERERLQSHQRPRDPLEIHGLSKTYSNGKTALDDLWLGIRAGECFGYLGINGAGKSTTLKCLTGFQRPSSGTAYIDGYNINKGIYATRKRSGYCPQFDALFEHLTVDEHLRMYCMIRGISLSVVPAMINAMQLEMYRHVPSLYLSGGNKRKLSAAIAMIGNPRVIFLDEPSTGMDPHAKRFLWKVISNIIKISEAALVLTTHSMEECEALCSRVAILINGQLQCLGSVQHLKSKFGRGYIVELRTRSIDPDAVNSIGRSIHKPYITSHNLQTICEELDCPDRAEKFLATYLGNRLSSNQSVSLQEFATWWTNEDVCDAIESILKEQWPNVILKSKHGQHILFEIPERKMILSELFERLESIDRVEYYSVSQTSLEEIFNTFARRMSVQSAIQSPR